MPSARSAQIGCRADRIPPGYRLRGELNVAKSIRVTLAIVCRLSA